MPAEAGEWWQVDWGRMRLSPPITSRTNPRVKALRAAFSGKAAAPGDLVGIEGHKSLLEAVEAGLHLDTLAVVEGPDAAMLDRIAPLAPRELLVFSPAVMASVTATISPPQLAATVAIPQETRRGPQSGIFLLLEEIQDPGNLGTLIRSAEAFGVERVFLSLGCANPWSPKVIRASAGSVFRQAVSRCPMAEALQWHRARHIRLVGAVARAAGATSSLACDLAPPIALMIGNEGSGLSGEALALAQETVYIPCLTESLNAAVAGSVLLYDILSRARQPATATPPLDLGLDLAHRPGAS